MFSAKTRYYYVKSFIGVNPNVALKWIYLIQGAKASHQATLADRLEGFFWGTFRTNFGNVIFLKIKLFSSRQNNILLGRSTSIRLLV